MKNKRLRLQNLEELFHETPHARIINDSRFTNAQVMGDFVRNLFYEIDSDLGFISTCECGAYRGNYYEGHVCPECGTQVSSQFTKTLGSVNWIGIPEHMPPVPHPIFFLILKEWLTKTKSNKSNRAKKVPVIQAILNPDDSLPLSIVPIIQKQGFKYFHDHLDEIMEFFFTKYKDGKSKTSQSYMKHVPYVKHILEVNRDLLFTRKLPILHPSLHPLSKEGKVKAVDSTAGSILQVITDLSTSAYSSRRSVTSTRYVDRMLWKCYDQYIKYIETIITKKLGDKFAHLRRHNTGSRIHFSARSVIVPMLGKHMGDEVVLPWKMILNGYKYEILNVLTTRMGYSFNDAVAKHARALMNYDEEINEILNILKNECPFKGFPLLINRNPSLVAGSLQLVFCCSWLKNTRDNVVRISARICKAPNADFDGQLN